MPTRVSVALAATGLLALGSMPDVQGGATLLDPLAEAPLPEQFDHVTRVRELPDGRAIVLDSVSRRVSVVDFTSGSVSPLGRDGDGPGEYRLPVRLLPLRGDSTAIVDLNRTRSILLIDERGAVSPGSHDPQSYRRVRSVGRLRRHPRQGPSRNARSVPLA